MQTEQAVKPNSLDALTGLRFIAAFVVLIAHTINSATQGEVRMGFLASNSVAFFFVLSGFILTYVYSHRLNKNGIFSFYRARWARVWPLHAACLFMGIWVWWWTGHLTSFSNFATRLVSYFSLTQSWVPIRAWANWFNGPSWSVSTEFGFYLVFPLLLWLGRVRFWPVLISVLALSVLALAAIHQPTMDHATIRYIIYVNPLFRLFEFTVGMMFGKFFLSRSQLTPTTNKLDSNSMAKPAQTFVPSHFAYEILALLTIILTLYLFSYSGPISSIYAGKGMNALVVWLQRGAGSAAVFGISLLAFGWLRGPVSNFLSSSTLVYLGEISYALYLVQYPVMAFVEHLPATKYLPVTVIFITLNLICFGLAAILHCLVETPFRRLFVSRSSSEMRYAWGELFAAPRRFFTNPINNWALSGLAISMISMFLAHAIIAPNSRNSKEALHFIASAQHRLVVPIKFQDEVILHGYQISQSNATIDITTAWEVLPSQQRTRIFHIVNRNDEIVHQVVSDPTTFANRGLILDCCSIQKSDLCENGKVGIVFYAKGLGSAKIDRGVRSMGKRRLDFFTWDGTNAQAIIHR